VGGHGYCYRHARSMKERKKSFCPYIDNAEGKWHRGSRQIVCFLGLPPPAEDYLVTEELPSLRSSGTSIGETAVLVLEFLWTGVMVTSAKNFQLLSLRPGGEGEGETILLRFGKVGPDDFTMEYT
ncbi:hypothetical protein CRG98_026834, partial [Punica granatum]